MSSSNAWLLECDSELIVAVSDHEIVEYLQPQRTFTVPETPEYCNRVIAWQDKLVPVMDLAMLTGVRSQQQEASFVCLLGYQLAPREPLQYLALRINTTPQKLEVDDSQACELEGDAVSPLLQAVTLCSFRHMQQTIPIIDVGKMCSHGIREMAQAGDDSGTRGTPVEQPVSPDTDRALQ